MQRQSDGGGERVAALAREVSHLMFLLMVPARGQCLCCNGVPSESCTCIDELEAMWAAYDREGRTTDAAET